MARPTITVFGGSGFIGRHVVRRLAGSGARVQVAVRDTEGAGYLKPMGDVAQIVPLFADLTQWESVSAAARGSDAVINLVGILAPSGRQTFDRVHAEGAGHVARAAKAAGATRLVHVSAIGADPNGQAAYARTKAAGEAAVKAAFPGATILRPSIVFGPEDDFFNRFAGIARLAPALPVFGSHGGPRFQPVYVGDVADAVVAALDSDAAAGRTFELGGPRVYTFRQILEIVLKESGQSRLLPTVPLGVAEVLGRVLQWLPGAPLTRDQVLLMRRDNVVSEGAPGLSDLGIEATAVEAVVPTYLRPMRRRKRQEQST